MRTKLNITFNSGESAVATVLPPEWVKWETKTGQKMTAITADNMLGISDLTFLAYHALKREAGGTPFKPYEVWIETVIDVDVEVEREFPKVMKSEASAD